MLKIPTIALLFTLAVTPLVQVAHADDCGGQSIGHVLLPTSRWNVELRFDELKNGWQFRVARPDASWQLLPAFGRHAHLIVFVGAAVGSFAVMDTSAEHYEADRLIVVDTSNAKAPTFKKYGLADLLDAKERATVSRSISHIFFFAESKTTPYGLEADGRALWFDAVGGRRVVVPLK